MVTEGVSQVLWVDDEDYSGNEEGGVSSKEVRELVEKLVLRTVWGHE
jgi:hypothetical protein